MALKLSNVLISSSPSSCTAQLAQKHGTTGSVVRTRICRRSKVRGVLITTLGDFSRRLAKLTLGVYPPSLLIGKLLHQPSALAGRTAVGLVEEKLSAGPGFQHWDVFFQPQLIVRQSAVSRE